MMLSTEALTPYRPLRAASSIFPVAFIKIRLLDALKDDVTVVHGSSKVGLQKDAQFQIVDRTAFHGLEVGGLVHLAPVHHLAQMFLQQHVQPDARGAAVAFQKGVGNVHFYILGNDGGEVRLRHLLNGG